MPLPLSSLLGVWLITWAPVARRYGLPPSRVALEPEGCCSLSSCSLPPKFTLQLLEEDASSLHGQQKAAGREVPSERCPFPAQVVSNQRVTTGSHFQDVRLIEFDITAAGME